MNHSPIVIVSADDTCSFSSPMFGGGNRGALHAPAVFSATHNRTENSIEREPDEDVRQFSTVHPGIMSGLGGLYCRNPQVHVRTIVVRYIIVLKTYVLWLKRTLEAMHQITYFLILENLCLIRIDFQPLCDWVLKLRHHGRTVLCGSTVQSSAATKLFHACDALAHAYCALPQVSTCKQHAITYIHD